MGSWTVVLIIILVFICCCLIIGGIFSAISEAKQYKHEESMRYMEINSKFCEISDNHGDSKNTYDGTPITIEPSSDIKINSEETCASCIGFKHSDYEEPCKGCSHIGGGENKYKKAEGNEE